MRIFKEGGEGEMSAGIDSKNNKTGSPKMSNDDNPPKSKRLYKVFVSSTYLDNQERRKIVQDAITTAGMVWHGMEIFAASIRPTVEECLRYVREADLLIGIVAWRYGWEPDGEKSITEMEYDAAYEAGIGRLMFQLDPNLLVNQAKDYDQGEDRWKKQEKLEAFKKRFDNDQMRTYFNETNLSGKVLHALNKWREEREPIIKEGNLDTRPMIQKDIDKERALQEYLRDVIAGTSHIDIQGISSASGAGRKPIRFPIEEHYTPLKTMSNPREMKETSMMDGKAFDEARRVPLTDLLSTCQRLLIVGEPGGGKTTFLRFIACVLARDALGRDKPSRNSHLGLTLDEPPPIPILIKLSVLAGVLKKGCPASHGSSAWRVLVQAMEELFETETVSVLKGLLDEERCALLLDSLDEEPDMNIREKMVEVTNAVLHHWGRNLIVITSRPFGYQAVAALEEMRKAEIDAFSEGEILEFLSRWAKALFPDEDERNRRAYLPELRSAVFNVPRIRRMAKNPVMLTCLCVVHWNEKKLPEGKADLLTAVLRWLINAKEEKRKARGYHNTFAVECFKSIAFSMTNHLNGKQVSADLSWAAEQLKVPFRDELNVEDEYLVRKRGMEFLDAETIDSGIIEQAGTGQVRFWHLTFQEHYAAKALVELGEGDGEDGWWHIVKVHLYDRQWDEVIDHFVGCLAQIGRRGLNLLIERILATATTGDLASIARVVGVLGRILPILDVYDYEPPQRLGWENIQRQVMDIFSPEGALRVPVDQRISAAEALGGSGDPRFNSIDPEMLPIKGMPDILLGKYPVTVQEYQRFIESGGYEEPLCWGEGWKIKTQKNWKGPSGWEEQKEHLNRPVIGVSWYEGGAYCNWLSKQTGHPYRLPKDKEWGKAATPPKGEYPWGEDQPNEELLNFNNNVGNPTPVGVYPAGAAPGGHLDMSGSVWEWNQDLYDKRGAYRVIRGGGWHVNAQGCRSAIRYSFISVSRLVDLGFRLSRSV
jgi:hypothetical protein